MLVTFEGGDGAGKSTIAAMAVDRICAMGVDAILIAPKRPRIRESALAGYMQRFASILWETGEDENREVFSTDHWLRLSSAWYEIVDTAVIQPALDSHDIVILDTWYHKLIARFSLKPGIESVSLDETYKRLTRPDMTMFLDIEPAQAVQRKKIFGPSECGNLDGLRGQTAENFIAYQSRVRQSYLGLARRHNWFVVDAGGLSADEVAAHVVNSIAGVLASHRPRRATMTSARPLRSVPSGRH
ncbi:hypothetical protein GR247_39035 [Rhizobium leguminosarum]|nr:hypothetical protein [Rhizobium leguminosarum]